jgi:Helix-turn-helix domain
VTAAKEAGAALRARRRTLTRPQLAALLDCSQTTLYYAETGRRPPPRGWWAHADRMLDANGEILRLFDGAPDSGPLWPAWDEDPLPAPGIRRPARMS